MKTFYILLLTHTFRCITFDIGPQIHRVQAKLTAHICSSLKRVSKMWMLWPRGRPKERNFGANKIVHKIKFNSRLGSAFCMNYERFFELLTFAICWGRGTAALFISRVATALEDASLRQGSLNVSFKCLSGFRLKRFFRRVFCRSQWHSASRWRSVIIGTLPGMS